METVIKIPKTKKTPRKFEQFTNLEEAIQFKQSEIKKVFRNVDLKTIGQK